MSRNFLIISYYFPPYSRVGSRRWAKHCKYFQKSNINFQVLAGNFSGSSSWDKDIKSYNERITRVKLLSKVGPYFMQTLPKNFLEKIYWKCSLIYWNYKKERLTGNYNDPSRGDEASFLSSAEDLITKNKIDVLIFSVGPFDYSKILLQIKSKFPHIKLVLDYRDYWEDVFSQLNSEQIDSEKELQKKVLNITDLVLSPNREMQSYYISAFNKRSYILPHCVDLDDIENIQADKVIDSDELKLLYGGAFYSDIEPNLKLIGKTIAQMRSSKKVKAEFFTSTPGFEQELIDAGINRYNFIKSEEYFKKVKQSDYVILILPPNRANAMSSKFFELVALRKPILYFGITGDVSNFIIKHNLGFHITPDNFIEQVENILENLIDRKKPDLGYDIYKHTFEYQTKLLINEIESL